MQRSETVAVPATHYFSPNEWNTGRANVRGQRLVGTAPLSPLPSVPPGSPALLCVASSALLGPFDGKFGALATPALPNE